MTGLDAEQNLLFGMLALQNGFIEQADLNAAFQFWSKDKARPLARILVERGSLSEEDRDLLEELARRHVAKHGGDPGQSLVAVGAMDTVTAVREQVADPLLEFKLDGLSALEGEPAAAGRQEATVADRPIASDVTFPWVVADGISTRSRFRILRPHGGGGLGLVSVAMDSELNREVALKEIRPELADDPQSRARFLLEAEVTGQLEHPGVVPVYGLQTDRRGRPYYAMRFVRGEDLKGVIARHHGANSPAGQTPPARALALHRLLTRFVAVCEAMSYAHDRGVIHRDLKPSNILLGPYGETMVVDWGLAKVLRPDGTAPRGPAEAPLNPTSAIASGSSDTLAGTVVGSPAYMSPEQAEGWPEGVGPASDVYSLGATLYTLLVGKPPFSGANIPSVLRRVRQGDFPPPRSVNPAVPPALEAVSRKAMSLRPEDRHASARELAVDIEHWMADEPISWLVEPWGQRLSRWGRRNRVLVRTGGSALAVVTLISLVAALLINASRVQERTQRIEANTQRARAEDERRRAEERSLEVQRMSARVVLDEGLAMCEQGDVARGMLRLARSLELLPPMSPALEGQIRMNLAGWGDRIFPLRTQLVTRGKAHAAAFSPDGTRLVTASEDGTARVWDAATGRPITPPFQHAEGVAWAAFSPDGTRVVTASDDRTVRVWDATSGRPITPAMEHRGRVNRAAFSPDGTRVVTASEDRTAQVWDATDGRRLTPPLSHGDDVTRAVFSPDGTRIATASSDRSARVWDPSDGRPLTPPLEHDGQVTGVAFSPDGTLLVTTSTDGTARVWDARSGERLGPPLTHLSRVNHAAFRPDGKWIITASGDSTARVWDVGTGRAVGLPLQHVGAVLFATFSHDGTRIATASQDNSARVWNATTLQALGSPLWHRNWAYSAEFSTDDTRLLTASRDFNARVWDLRLGGSPRPPLRHGRTVPAANFSPDGTRIVTASTDRTARVWDVATGLALGPPLEHKAGVRAATFSPDGRHVLTASTDGTARIWDAATGLPVNEPLRHNKGVNFAAFSPDGARIVTASGDRTARIWDVATGLAVGEPIEHGGIVWSAAFSPDGSRIVTASADRKAQVWDVATGRALGPPLVHDSECWWAVFSPDGTRVATAGQENTAHVWDAATGRPLAPRPEHRGFIHTIIFSPDGTRLLTASDDRTVRLWDATTGRPLGAPIEHDAAVWWAAFSPDGSRIVTAGSDRTARVRELPRPLDLDPRSIVSSVQSWTGLTLDDQGGIVIPDGPSWEAARRRLESSGSREEPRPRIRL